MSKYIFATKLNGTDQEGIVYYDNGNPKALCLCPRENADKIIEALNYFEDKPLNSGWTRIESEADLPKDSDRYWVLRNGVIDIGVYSVSYNKWMCSGQYYFSTMADLKITHYQPIIKPDSPIY